VIFSGPARFPCVLGHEYAGRVVELGPGVQRLRVGDVVAAEGMLYCGLCEACRRGRFNQCQQLEMTGFSAAGALAEYTVVHEKHCWSLQGLVERLGSAQRAAELGSLVEPTGCAYNGIWVTGRGMLPGAVVAVFGCGPIGLGAIALCRAAGASQILAFDPSKQRRSTALAMGADHCWDPIQLAQQGLDASELLLSESRGWGADLLVEAAGAALHTFPSMESALAPGGQIIYLGRTGQRAPVLLDRLVSSAAHISGARGHAGGGVYPQILRLLERDRLRLDPMISARLPMSSAIDALERSRERRDSKILLTVGTGSADAGHAPHLFGT
jgi:threonine dehydrogenase-like Zn-dependent dehydrogenase